MKKVFFVFLGLLVLTISTARAENKSKDELLKNVEKACVEKSYEQFHDLYLWQGVEDQMSKMTETMIREILKQPVWDVSFEALDKNEKTEHILNGYKYHPNVKLEGYIKVSHDEKNPYTATLIPFGRSKGKYYLANTIKEKLKGDFIRQKQISVNIWGSSSGSEHLTFEGTAVYYLNGEKQTKNLNGEYSKSLIFYGDYLETVFVSKTSNGGSIQLILEEDGKEIFNSGETASNEKIIYNK